MEKVSLLKPRVATAGEMLPRLAAIDAAAVYSNHGPQERQLRTALAARLGGRPVDEIATFSSGTSALVAALRAFDLPPGAVCLVPSWTFVGSACAVHDAGLVPYFVDIDAERWTPSPAMIEQAAAASGAAAAMVVAPFGAALDYDGLAALSARTGLRILVDGAAAFDWVDRLAATGRPLPLPIMVSLHATKLVSALEGGFVVQSDPAAVAAMVKWSNFGIFGQQPIRLRGTNAKLSEVHAAYGQASLAMWDETRAMLSALAGAYRAAIDAGIPGCGHAPNLGDGLVSSTYNLVLPRAVDGIDAAMAAAGIETRRWWRRGIHRLPAFADAARDPLPMTEALADRVIGLPFHTGIDAAAIARVVAALKAALAGA